ncbi:MAG: hypothetical protein ACKVP0_05850 [Pirellulaceae bacterium]
MNRTQTTPYSVSSNPLDLESDTIDQEECSGQTVVLAGIRAKDTGNTALTQLDALSSLVQQEAVRDDRRPAGSRGEHGADGAEEALDDYMKLFMERVTGRKSEVVEPAQPVQPALPSPTNEATAEVRLPARAPENSASLDRMRDVANATSRSALQVHAHRQYSNHTTTIFFPAALASLASTVMAVLGAATGSGWCQAGAVGLLAVALVFGWQFWKSSRKLYQGAC